MPIPVRPEIPVYAALAALATYAAIKLKDKAVEAAGAAAARVAAYARIAAALAVLASSRGALAAPGKGEDPLVAFYRLMTEAGEPPSPELKKLIDSDPQLQEAIRKAVTTGDVTKAQEELSKRTMQVIEDNADQFSARDIEEILKRTEGAGLPGGDITAAKLRKALDARGGGKKGGTEGGGGTGGGKGKGTAPKPPTPPTKAPAPPVAGPGTERAPKGAEAGTELPLELRTRLSQAGPAVERLWSTISGPGPGALKATPELLDAFLKRTAIDPPLTDAEAERLLAAAEPAKGDQTEFLKRLDEAMTVVRGARAQGAGPPAEEAQDAGKGRAPSGKAPSEPPKPEQQPSTERFGDVVRRLRPVVLPSPAPGDWAFRPLEPFAYERQQKDVSVFVLWCPASGVVVGSVTTLTVLGPAAGGRWKVDLAPAVYSTEDDATWGTFPEPGQPAQFEITPTALAAP